jgi:hypothetical protein
MGPTAATTTLVMPGLEPGIHAFPESPKNVDGLVKPGHDG